MKAITAPSVASLWYCIHDSKSSERQIVIIFHKCRLAPFKRHRWQRVKGTRPHHHVHRSIGNHSRAAITRSFVTSLVNKKPLHNESVALCCSSWLMVTSKVKSHGIHSSDHNYQFVIGTIHIAKKVVRSMDTLVLEYAAKTKNARGV